MCDTQYRLFPCANLTLRNERLYFSHRAGTIRELWTGILQTVLSRDQCAAINACEPANDKRSNLLNLCIKVIKSDVNVAPYPKDRYR
jgi:hypothetical protein